MRTSLLLLLSVLCMAPAAAEDAGRPSYSAWYRFEGAQVAGVGETPWPAYPLGAGAGHGRFGGGLVLPGTGGNGLYLPNPAAFFGREASRGTIALWVKPAFSPAEEKGQRVVFDFMRDTGNTLVDGYQIVLFTDGDRLKAKPCLDRQMAIPNPLRKGEWTHLALAWDSSQGTALYVDGEKKAEIPAPFRPTELEAGWPGRVGCHTPGGGFAFAGTLDELRLFNTRLGEAEVRTLKGLDPARPQMVVIGDWVGGVTVANAGAAPAALSLQAWLPGRHAAPPHRGALPFPFGAVDPTADYWTAGVTPAERVAGPLTLAPGERRRLSIPTTPAYLGPRQVRLMAGEGLAAQEVASRTFAGLCVKPTHCRPLVVPDDRPASLPAHVTNDLGGPFAGSLRADVLDAAGKRVAGCALPVNLAAGKSVGVALALGQRLPLGAYRLRVRDGAGGVIEELPLFAARAGRPDRLCLVGASYVGAPDNPKVLSAMAADGVGVLRLHGKLGDAYSFEKNLSALLPHGFKVTRMAAASYRSVCTDPEKRRTLVATARSLGRLLRDNPAVINQVIGGEGLSAPPCYCAHCAAAFRDSLRREYATLHALNNAWGTAYKAWGDIQQIGSPRDIDETAERLKMMKVALDLPAENTARWRRLFSLDRTRAMAWKRWHERLLVDWYAAFARAFRETNGGRVPVGEQPCWPNFESHVLFALGDIAGMGGMDLYLPGEMATTLGYAAELFLNFDMNASIFASRGKPVMLHELYVQDNSPELLPEAQGWWLVGRGYNILTYFTYDYYYEGVRANQPLIFGLFGKTGKPYPAYPSFVRFGRALKEFDRRYGCATLGREHPRVALFMGDDVSLANNLESGGATWEAAGVKGHNGAYWLTERAGLPVEFVNDDGLDRLAGKKAMVVHW